MRVCLQWLRDFLDTDASPERLASVLTMGGLEVESVDRAGPELPGVVVGEVLKVSDHPAAEKLHVAEVAIDADSPRQIVCGASNLRVGQRVAVALPDARLPNGQVIQATELRGVASAGMLCSAAELGLEDGSTGLLELDAQAPLGMALETYLGLDTPVFTLGITPNRGDALSLRGVARDLAALGAGRLRPGPAVESGEAQGHGDFPHPQVSVEAAEACPLYSLRLLTHLPQRLPDLWRERLRRSEQKSISPMVDWLNLWMMAWGQPMHGFDADALQGAITVRWARSGEILDALDGRDLPLEPDMLVIADTQGPVALAGIIGGRRTSVQSTTQRVLLESAFFSARAIQGRARRLGLQTEAAQRYERGVDFALPVTAGSALLSAVFGDGQMTKAGMAVVEGPLPQLPTVLLRRDRVQRTLALNMSDGQVQSFLTALGVVSQEDPQGWRVTPPSHRYDLRIEADYIEELGRLWGYERLPSRVPLAPLRPLPETQRPGPLALRQALAARDYHEVITYSFISGEQQAEFYPEAAAWALSNPLSGDLAVMRSGLWPGLLQAVRFNRYRQQERVRLFEWGRAFGGTVQGHQLAAVAMGTQSPEHWAESPRPLDFFDMKGDLEALLAWWPGRDFQFSALTDVGTLHPGQAAEILCDGVSCGQIGALHPRLQAAYDLEEPVFLFMLNLDCLPQPQYPAFERLSAFPSVMRDLALVIPAAVPAGAVLRAVQKAGIQNLLVVRIFDRYDGEHVPVGHYSLGLRLQFQDLEVTLTEDSIQAGVQEVLSTLRQLGPIELRNGA